MLKHLYANLFLEIVFPTTLNIQGIQKESLQI